MVLEENWENDEEIPPVISNYFRQRQHNYRWIFRRIMGNIYAGMIKLVDHM